MNEAREWVRAASPQARALNRGLRPSLSLDQMPFGETQRHYDDEPMSCTGQPRRLPSLTMEAFSAIKRREGVDSRCSDPGFQAPLSVTGRHGDRSSSKKNRRRERERGTGSSSAPVSRGDQVAELMTPLFLPEPPLTEPNEARGKHMRRCNSGFLCNTPDRGTRGDQGSRGEHVDRGEKTPGSATGGRPPMPVSTASSANAKHKRSGYNEAVTPGHSALSSEASPSSASPMQWPAVASPSPEKARSSRHSLRESPPSAATPEPGKGGPRPGNKARSDSSKERQQQVTPQRRLDLKERSRSPSNDPVPRSPPPEEDMRAFPEDLENFPSDPRLSELPLKDGWDEGSESFSQSRATSSRSRLNYSSVAITKGPRGITSLALAANASGAAAGTVSLANFSTDSFSTPRPHGSSYEGTMSSPDAIRGSEFAWVKGQILGRGSMGSVYEGLDQRTGQIFAVKEVRIDHKVDSDVRLQKELQNEVDIYKDLKHAHIVSYLGHDYLSSYLYIYLEYMPGGSVAQVLSQFGPFAEELIQRYAWELLEGMEYLHTRTPIVLHRDIKGANILVGNDGGVKLSDFGCSKRTADTLSQSLRGSIPWMAPEVIQQTGYGRRSDVWSFGCVIIEMATAKHPWGSFDNPMAAMMRIGMSQDVPPVPDMLSAVCQDFIVQCTQRDKNLRPLATTLLQHEFVRDFRPEPD
ncbi:unnamed protein product [Polarella glacialis]|nr:unnamed protein product [Polarella glacialis]